MPRLRDGRYRNDNIFMLMNNVKIRKTILKDKYDDVVKKGEITTDMDN